MERQKILDQIDKALMEIGRICRPDNNWRMSIPANPECDSDLIIGNALIDAKEFIIKNT